MVLNNSTQANETWPVFVLSIDKVIISLSSLLLVWSLLGNVLVIAVVYCNQNLRTNLNYMIVSMAVSDLLVPLFAIPLQIAHQIAPSKWLVDGPLGNALCKLVPFLSGISPIVSSLSLVIIASQRFIAVVYPARTHIFSCKARWIFIALPWFVSMVLFSPDLVYYRVEKKYDCIFDWPSTVSSESMSIVIYVYMLIVLGFVIPLTTIIVLYSIIHHKLKKNIKNVKEMIGREAILARQRTNRRIFCMSLTIVINFVISWCPLSVIRLWFLASLVHDQAVIWLVSLDAETLKNIFFSIFYLYYLQTAITPCIYFLFLRDFRQGLKQFCCRKPAQRKKKHSCSCVCYGPRPNRTRAVESNQPLICMYITSV